MKILWFANTPCGATKKLSPDLNVGGWLPSLEKELASVNDIELSVAFYWDMHLDNFEFNDVTYYPIHRTKKSKLKNKLTNLTDDSSEVESCLNIVQLVNPNIIHIHGTEDNFGLIQEYTDIPIIVSIQGLLAPYAEKFYSGIPKAIADKYETLKDRIIKNTESDTYKRFYLRGEREKKILSLSKNIMGRTDWDRRISQFLSPNSKYFVGEEILRGNFYSTDLTSKNYFAIEKNTYILTSTISGGLYKGIETLFKCARLLKEQNLFSFEWNIIGLNPSSKYIKIVSNWLKISPLAYNINLLGNKNEFEMTEIFKRTNAYVHMSHIENSPNSVCEAMLVGLPVIASNVGGTSSLITDGVDGLLYQDGEIYTLASLINELRINKNDSMQSLRSNARKTALKKHDPNTIVNNLVSTYNSIISELT
ncbi:MAG: glycosyl transferase family 1 [Pseudopedobacter saltans]|uniref:Glycosyl transferase family 1 n=1 Tax=Pseudopedobacter saltans TaxID=151895 RepID=A0A2W5GG20_9SPHI|nr:MAG: glycosyl transferase family 1 [Pseudopedobacter saltans]